MVFNNNCVDEFKIFITEYIFIKQSYQQYPYQISLDLKTNIVE